jgi:hypothetical protein
MNPRQIAMYWAEWAKLRDVLRAKGRTHAEIETERHSVTIRALGAVKSSKVFTNAELDRVLARIKAEREPDNFAAQMALQDSPDKRRASALEACMAAAWEIYNHGGNNFLNDGERRERYVNGIARNVVKKELGDCTAEELWRVRGILLRHVERVQRTNVEVGAANATAAKADDEDENPF